MQVQVSERHHAQGRQSERTAWADVELFGESKIRVPLIEPIDLDAFSLRGRRMPTTQVLCLATLTLRSSLFLGPTVKLLEVILVESELSRIRE
jgi:hypothetical protein